MGASDVWGALVDEGMDESLVKAEWKRVQPKLASHPQVAYEGRKYVWSDAARPARPEGELTAAEAVAQLVKGAKLKVAERTRLGQIALSALDGPAKPRATGRAAAVEEAERHRHLETKIRGEYLRALADLAMDLEEQIGNEASALTMIERIRTTTQAQGLEPIGDVGEVAAFDGRIHHPIAGSLNPETSVIVMRPGYFWRAGKDSEVLMAKARVIDQ